MIKYLFLDLDDTILDFHKAERLAIARTFREFGLEPTEEVLARYHVINKRHWERLETGELTRDQVKLGRFAQLFAEMGIPVQPAQVAKQYEHNLGIGHYFLPGAMETVEELHKSYRLYLASNGTASVQHSRLTSANLYPWFEKVFVSEELGCNKPSLAFFHACFAAIEDFDPSQAMMVGDSLTSDILGGINSGIKTCWINPTAKPPRPDIRPDYTIPALFHLPALLNQLK